MADSASTSYNLLAPADDIITEALELLGVLGEGDTPSDNQLTSCARTLNYMIKAWQARGTNLFAVQREILFLEKDKHEYEVYTSTSEHWANFNDFEQTTLSAAITASATTGTVATAGTIATSDNIGVYLDDGTMKWVTVSSIASTTVTFSAAPGAASSGAAVYVYTNKAQRPRRILDVVVRDVDKDDIPVEVISRQEYHELASKTSDGKVTQIYFEPGGGQSGSEGAVSPGKARIFTWPETDDPRDYLVCWVERTIADIDSFGLSSGDSHYLDFPQEWFLPLAYNLALWVGPKFGMSDQIRGVIAPLAEVSLNDAEYGDTEISMRYTPDDRWRR